MKRYKAAKLASILGIIGNVFLLIIKALAGYITNSQVMISDAFNSAGDIFASIMTFIGNKIASAPADEDHNMGHGKAEYIFSMFISLSMMFVCLKLFYSSFLSLFTNYSYHFSYTLILVCIVTIITKFCLYLYTHHLASDFHNLLIEANAKDHRNDCILTALNLIASIFGMFGITMIDGIAGSLVSLWLLFTGIKIFKESYDVLMDKGMDELTKEKVLSIVEKYPEIKKTNHFNSTPSGYQYQISITIFVDGNLSTFESHEIANRLEKDITALEEVYLAIIHVNPI